MNDKSLTLEIQIELLSKALYTLNDCTASDTVGIYMRKENEYGGQNSEITSRLKRAGEQVDKVLEQLKLQQENPFWGYLKKIESGELVFEPANEVEPAEGVLSFKQRVDKTHEYQKLIKPEDTYNLPAIVVNQQTVKKPKKENYDILGKDLTVKQILWLGENNMI